MLFARVHSGVGCHLRVLSSREQVAGGERREPGLACEGDADGVEGGEPVGGGGVKVAADPAPPGEGGLGMPVPGHGLVPLSGFGSLFGDVVRPLDRGLAGEQPHLVRVAAQPGAECVAGVVAVMPVPVPVMGDPGRDGLVVTLAQLAELLLIGWLAAGPCVLAGQVRLTEGDDHVGGPGLQAAGAEFADRAAAADDVRGALLDTRQIGEHLLVGGVPVGDQYPGEERQDRGDRRGAAELIARSQVSFPPGGRTISTCGAPSAGSRSAGLSRGPGR